MPRTLWSAYSDRHPAGRAYRCANRGCSFLATRYRRFHPYSWLTPGLNDLPPAVHIRKIHGLSGADGQELSYASDVMLSMMNVERPFPAFLAAWGPDTCDRLVGEVALPFEDVADSMFVAGLHLRPQVVILAHAILSDAAIGAASDADDYRNRTWVNVTGDKITKDDAR